MTHRAWIFAIGLAATSFTGCSGSTSAPDESDKSFTAQLTDAGIDLDASDARFTVFAPTAAALEQAEEEHPDLFADEDLRTVAMKTHVVEGDLDLDDLRQAAGTSLDTLAGIPVTVTVADGDVLIEGHRVGAPIEGDGDRTYELEGFIVAPGIDGG